MTEFWKAIPPNEPYRVLLGEVRNRLYHTRERSRHLLAHGYSDIPEEETFTNVEEVHSVVNFLSFTNTTNHQCYATIASILFMWFMKIS